MILAVSMVPGILLKILICIIVFLIGATAFSYWNVVIEELPKEAINEELEESERVELAPLKDRLTKGRSKCPHCGHAWKVKESLPIFSWLMYKKKCVYCFESISPRHTLIELLGGVLAVVTVAYYHISVAALMVFLVLCVLSIIAVIDMDTQYIPPELNLILFLLGVLAIWAFPGPTLVERFIGIASIAVPLIIIVLIVPEGFGWGDIKMMAAAGFLLGWKANVAAFFIGLVLGGAYGVYLLVGKHMDKREHFAFGPFLSIGIAISIYAGIGEFLMNQYIGMIIEIMQQS